jgi:hypothetical protein
MRFGILGTGVVGKTIAVRLAGLGHDVMVGTRDPQDTLSRTDPDQYGNPPFSAWQQEHPEVKLGTFGEAAAHGEMFLTTPRAVLTMSKSSKARSPASSFSSNRLNQPRALSGCPHATKMMSWIGMVATANRAAALPIP